LFGNRPFEEPSAIFLGALVFGLLFEGVSVLVDYVATGRLQVTWISLLFFGVAFGGYIAVAFLVRRKDSERVD